MLIKESQSKNEIFVSYAWEDSSEKIVDEIEKEFHKAGVTVIRDKKHLNYKGRIKAFMTEIGRGNYVVLVISDKYMKSENCMYELLQVFENGSFYDRIFPIILDDINISDPSVRIELIDYWEDKVNDLTEAIRDLRDLSNIQGITDDLNLYTEIRNKISESTHILKDINMLNTEKHIKSDFAELLAAVKQKMRKDRGPSFWVGVLSKILLFSLVVIAALIIAFPGLWKKSIANEQTGVTGKDTISSSLNDDTPGEESTEPSPQTNEFIVELTIPSYAEKILLDGEKASIIEQNQSFVKILVKEKKGSHTIEIYDSLQNLRCKADIVIKSDMKDITVCPM